MVKFTIIIPVKAINNYVRETIPYIQRLDTTDWELIILPNEVSVDEWCDERIKLIPTGKVGPATKRDMGSELSSGEILVFLDDDSYPKSDFLKIASKYFEDDQIVAIGGPAITPAEDSFWQKVSGAVFLSRVSGGNPERYISIGSVREVDDWPSVNFMVRKKVFIEIGGFNSPYWPGEDTKLCLDLIEKTQKKILYIPNLVVWHHRRAGLFEHLKQIGAYGMHRGHFARIYPGNSRKLKYFLPSALLLIFLTGILNLIVDLIPSFLWIPCLVAYILAVLYALYEISKIENIRIASMAAIYIPITHLYYGLKFIQGLLKKQLISRLR